VKKRLSLFLKIILGVLCFIFIGVKLKAQFTPEKKELFIQTICSEENSIFFLVSILFMVPNWFIESYKWQLITKSIEKISFISSVKGVFSGICIGNLTPGRIGEFAGKLLYFKPENRSKITVTHFICGSVQLFVTVIMGLISLVILLSYKSLSAHFLIFSFVFSSLLLIALIYFLFNAEKVYRKISKMKWLKKFDLGTVSYPKPVLIKLVVWSFLRYFVFSTQYVLLLKMCGAKGNYLDLFLPVAVSFMLMSSIPMISIIEVAVRAGIALVLFSENINNELLIVTASTSLWLINIIVPSIIGYFIILSAKIKPEFSILK